MALELKETQFCGLSRAKKWKDWLNTIAPNLLQNLNDLHKQGKAGCRANQEIMLKIRGDLYKNGHGNAFETFITSTYPQLIKKSAIAPTKKNIERISKFVSEEEYNKHKIFKSYRPSLLTFPHKYIICGPNDILEKRARLFVRDKVAYDYLIIEDRCYIEYFEKKYASEALRFPKNKREIFVYRQKLKNEASNNIK